MTGKKNKEKEKIVKLLNARDFFGLRAVPKRDRFIAERLFGLKDRVTEEQWVERFEKGDLIYTKK